MLTIDGSMGEGGGQVLRTSLACSLLTATPFHITNIRAGRARPGLMRQHLVAVRAAAEISDATISGAELGSKELVFRPKGIRAGDYTFALGGAGSTTLVFQTILYPLMLGASSPSTITFEGGTHNPMAPPVTFLEQSFLPALARMGGHASIAFDRYGFYPAGGGRWTATIHPSSGFDRLDLLRRGEVRSRSATAVVAQVPPSVALRELDTLAEALGWDRESLRPLMVERAHGPGNALLAFVESEHVTAVFTSFGERGLKAERVADSLAKEVARYLAADVPVCEHLSDQLLLAMALGSGGAFRTLKPSLHSLTQIQVAKLFLGVAASTTENADGSWCLEMKTGHRNSRVPNYS